MQKKRCVCPCIRHNCVTSLRLKSFAYFAEAMRLVVRVCHMLFLFSFYSCSHTVLRYLRHRARRVVELISVQMAVQVEASMSAAWAVSAEVMARALMAAGPTWRARTALTGDAPVSTRYRVGA